MKGRALRAAGLGLALAALAACGLKGDPVPPKPADAEATQAERAGVSF